MTLFKPVTILYKSFTALSEGNAGIEPEATPIWKKIYPCKLESWELRDCLEE
jgi:hypothetical protein